MPLKLTHYYRIPAAVITHHAVIGHLREVLNVFAGRDDCSKFYIGITGDLERRRKEHERLRSEFTLMCVIHAEEANMVEDSFHNLEMEAIRRFRSGVLNKETNRMLTCANGVPGSRAKNWLYLLVDQQDVSDVPFKRPGSVWDDT